MADGLLAQRKLALILDLDNTLIHASPLRGQIVSTSAENNVFNISFTDGKFGFQQHLVARRDYLGEFLQKASEICQLSVYTLGTRKYAEAVVSCIDPDGKYFGHRIVSQLVFSNLIFNLYSILLTKSFLLFSII